MKPKPTEKDLNIISSKRDKQAKQIDYIWENIILPYVTDNPIILNKLNEFSRHKLTKFIYGIM